MAMEECPRISETTFSGTPLASMTLAAECRRVCNPALGMPARAVAALNARRALRGSQGSPFSVVNTYPVSCHAEPACSRSVIWMRSMWCSSRSAGSDSGRRGCPEVRGTSVAARCASGCDDLLILHGGCDSSGDLGVERDAQLGQVQVAVDPAELLAGLDHPGGAPAQRHLPVPPALDVGRVGP